MRETARHANYHHRSPSRQALVSGPRRRRRWKGRRSSPATSLGSRRVLQKSRAQCLVGMQACATAHHWARELIALGHEVKLQLIEGPSSVAGWIADDRLFVLEGIGRVAALRREAGDIQQKAQTALRIMHDHAVHPWTVREELSALPAVINTKPTVASTAAEISKDAVRRASNFFDGLMKAYLVKW